MDSKEITMWKDMELNPLKVHLQIIVSGGRKALCAFVKNMAITHKLCLEVKPRSESMVLRWKSLSRCILKEILAHNPVLEPVALSTEQYISQGIYNAHVRRAYWRQQYGKDVIVKATIVNPGYMDVAMLQAIKGMVDSYNEKVVDVARSRGVRATTLPAIANWK